MARPLYVSAYAQTPDAHTIDLCTVAHVCPADEQERWLQLHSLLENAEREHATEIHLEPDHDCWRLRLRGPFSFNESRLDQTHIYRDCLNLLCSYLWGNAVHESNQHASARRGWFGFTVSSIPRLLQLDVVPSSRGRTYLITLLHAFKSPPPQLDELALNRNQLKQLRELLSAPAGLIVLASDLSQGRAQTARAMAQTLVAPDKKVVCADCPGHPFLPRTSQLAMDRPVSEQQRQSWMALCRMGADAIVACQSLDDDIAKNLTQYAAEDTLVVQGVGVTNAADAVDRLLSMGVRAEAIARTLSAIVVQRRVQCLCTYCREAQVPDDRDTTWLARYSPIRGNNINDWLRHRMRSSFSGVVGCERCQFTGYETTRDVFDIVTLSNDTIDALYDADIRYALSLLREQDAMAAQVLKLAQEGIITVSEAARIQPVQELRIQ